MVAISGAQQYRPDMELKTFVKEALVPPIARTTRASRHSSPPLRLTTGASGHRAPDSVVAGIGNPDASQFVLFCNSTGVFLEGSENNSRSLSRRVNPQKIAT
jgi:hypothetical protein